ncbi:hypothetical protein MNBD_ALPHA11-1076 [hydrothermal vent metagenome]|uniref:DUF2059 domain-containing protein n=1 Tax=hydrothermal vent metagenome TaxID=652676 RepID=A0A3B0UAA9_9ZZZZ
MTNMMFSWFFKPLRAIFIALLTIMAIQTPANAQELDVDRIAMARQYVDLTDGAQLFETTLIRTGIETMRTLVSQNPTEADAVSDAIGVVIEAYSTRKDELFNQFARVYALRFSMEELREIVAFYETEVGRKLSASNSIINTELSTVMQIYQANLNIEFFAQVRAELRANGIEM